MKSSINELIKTLFREKTVARISKYQAGQIFYRFNFEDGIYEFAIDTVTESSVKNDKGDNTFDMSGDLGTTAFNAEVRASELTRWIKKRAMVNELVKVG